MAHDIAVGRTVAGLGDQYEVEARLGEGGFSETWTAKRLSDGASVVLKLLRLDRAGDLKALELFEREAKVLAATSHPRIPKTYEFFAWNGERAFTPYDPPGVDDGAVLRWVMVQERVMGRSLRQMISDKARLNSEAVTSLLRDVLEILEYLHDLQPPVIHRDITPGNVILSDDGRAHLVDFGAIQDRLRRASTVASTSIGTFGYLAMEQMMGQARPATDLFALGMTSIVLASHREPEELPLDEATGKVDLQALGLGLGPETMAALDRMIEPIVGQRIQSARECRAILDGETPVAALARREPNLPSAAEPKLGWLWKMSAGAGGLAAGGIYLMFFNSFSETELIQVSTLWVAPVAFGGAGHLAELRGSRNPIASAFLGAGLAVVALILFIFGIFPAL